MSEITATVQEEQFITASTNVTNPAVLESMSQIADVDLTTLVDGSILVYKTATSKWTSTTLLDMQNVEAGEF